MATVIKSNAKQATHSTSLQKKGSLGVSHSAKISAIRPKLKIGAPNDIYEQEADAMADHVVKQPAQPSTAIPIKPLATKEPIQAKLSQNDNVLETKLNSTKGGGSPLLNSTCSLMENNFSADFSKVRIHTDSKAVQMNQRLDARAFTRGSDIYFNKNQYNPDSHAGKHLLAHELTHTLQQDAIIRKKSLSISKTSPCVQRFSLIEMLNKITAFIPGYDLIKLLIGKGPVSGTKIIKALLGLVPVLGPFLIRRLQSTGSLEKAGNWLSKRIKKLNITRAGIKALFVKAKEKMSVFKWLNGGNITIIKKVFAPTLRRIKNFAQAITTKIKEFVIEGALSLAGGAAKQVLGTMKRGKAVFKRILDNPIQFIRNFMFAVKLGFNRFSKNFIKHFKSAIFGWIFGTLSKTGIQLPKKFDLKGIFSLVAQILNLTYTQIRSKIVKKLGPKGERIMTAIEQSVTFIKDLITKGPIVLWEKVKDFVGNLKNMIIRRVTTWVTETIIGKAITKLVSMLNPVGALIQAALAIYNTVMFFINRWQQIKSLVNSIFNSINRIAFHKVKSAAVFIENSMARGLTLLISFLARLIGLGGISEKVRDIIKKIRKPIDKAVDKITGVIIRKGRALFARGKAVVKGGIAKVVEWWKVRKSFKMGKENHTLYFKGSAKSAKLIVASKDPVPLETLIRKGRWQGKKLDPKVIERLKDKQEEFSNLKKKSVNENKKWGIAMKKLMIAVANILAEANVGTELPKTKVRFGPVEMGELDGESITLGGTSMTAEPLSLQDGTTSVPDPKKGEIPDLIGSQPGGKDSKLGKRLKETTRYKWVAGHLLNHKTYGTGKSLRNLAPITAKANNWMMRNPEKKLKKAVLRDAKVVSYHVSVSYPKKKATKPIDLAPTIMRITLSEMKHDGKKKKGKEWKKMKDLKKTFP